MKLISTLYIACFAFFLIGCSDSTNEQSGQVANEPTLFTLLPAEQTGVDFQNIINEGLNTNVLMYEYFYNGGGVAVGDFSAVASREAKHNSLNLRFCMVIDEDVDSGERPT